MLGRVGLALVLALGIPPNPGRESAPPGIEQRAVAVGAEAPRFELPAVDGSAWSLEKALGQGPAVLVFYRGYW